MYRLDGFKGAMTSVHESLLPKGVASDTLNARSEDGSLTMRYGLSGLTSSFSGTSRGLHLARGYNDSYVFKEEYVGFRSSGGSVKPYSIDVDTGTGTEITDGATPLALTNAEWYGQNFGGYAYYLSPGSTVYKHEIETNTSWSAADPGQPNQFTTGNYPWLTFERTESNSPTAGTTVSWAGFGGGGFTDNGGSGVCPTSHSAVSGSTEQINAANGGTTGYLWYDFTLDLNSTTAGIQDWTNATGIQVTISRTDLDRWQWADDLTQSDWPWAIGSGNARVWLSDNAGSPNTVELTGAVQTIVDELGDYYYRFLLTIPVASRGATWSDSRKLRFLLPSNNDDGPSSAAVDRDFDFQISQITVDSAGSSPATPDQVKIRFGAVAYSDDLGVEANNPTMSEEIKMSIKDASRYFESSAANTFLGNVVTVNIPTAQMTTFSTATNVDKIRWYVAFMDEGTDSTYTFRLMAETAKTVQTYEVPYTYKELRALPERVETINDYTALGNPTCFCAFHQWMVWGYPGGSANIKHSRIGNPVALASTSDDAGGTDLQEDLNRGATFTLADNFADEPQCIVGAGDSLYILGNDAVYVQSPLDRLAKPYNMSPCRRVPQTIGVLGRRAACNWKSNNGVEGVAYVSADAENLWFIVAASNYSDVQYQRIELTSEIRGKMKEFLFQSTAPDVDKVYVFTDERDDALWVAYKNRAMVLRRRNFVEGKRPWEFYSYNLSNPRFLSDWATHIEHGLRVLRDDGRFIEAERVKSTNFTPVTGSTRDDGLAVSSCYWQGAKVSGPNRRCFRVRVEREVAASVDITVYTDRKPSGETVTVAAADRHKRFGQFLQGWNHTHKIAIGATQTIFAVEFEETPLGKRVNS